VKHHITHKLKIQVLYGTERTPSNERKHTPHAIHGYKYGIKREKEKEKEKK